MGYPNMDSTEHEQQTKNTFLLPTVPQVHYYTPLHSQPPITRYIVGQGPRNGLRHTREQEMKAFLVVLTELSTLLCVPEYREKKVDYDSLYDVNLIIQEVQSG